ncbi:MAG TPA: M15 family metallopeptidase [Leptolyngbyaceae cyanobacterium]
MITKKKLLLLIVVPFWLGLFFGCQNFNKVSNVSSSNPVNQPNNTTVKIETPATSTPTPPPLKKTPQPKKIDKAQLVDIQTVNPNILLDIRYATENNFMKKPVYSVARCVLRGEVAEKLSQVQQDLEKQGLGLKVYDCYRPLSVQKLMWQVREARPYVANPARGSKHNRGAAVDITLVDRNGQELEMPTEFDNFTRRASITYAGASTEAKKNRALLGSAMKRRGFIPLSKEWWHFDAIGWQKYKILDVPLDAVPR